MNINVPLVSIVTATYNAQSTLARCINSILSQTYPNIEYIIIDGGSTDDTINIIKEYENRLVYWTSEQDDGVYDAWNKGLKIAKGDWICFVGADDELYPKHTETYMNFILLANQKYDYITSKVDVINAKGEIFRTIGNPHSWKRFKQRMCCMHVGSMHSADYFKRFGNFNTNYKIVGDYEILLRAKDQLKVGFIDQSTVKMQSGGLSDSSKLFKEISIAKIQTAKRNSFVVRIEDFWFYSRFLIRKFLLSLGITI